ncbi:hypothetical protein AB0F81_12845 [Actinoplanes sp. NPDC024001]|uniref:hypothetical protein n=1 Tax=Actinoplanes sp. NPDC024001 TaxID=3154598 RepID=UPI00340063A4
MSAAEVAGFLAPAVVGALTARSTATVTVPALLAAGAVEGTLLGWGQATVLRRELSDFPRRRWIVRTAAAAVLAYAIGVLPSAFADTWQNWPIAAQVAAALLLGLVLLNSIGVAQWTVLRHLLPHPGRWVWFSAAAWLAGLTVFLIFTMPLWQPGQALAVTVAVGVAGALLMAVTMASVTGVAVVRLLRLLPPEPGRGRVNGPEPLRSPRAGS